MLSPEERVLLVMLTSRLGFGLVEAEEVVKEASEEAIDRREIIDIIASQIKDRLAAEIKKAVVETIDNTLD